MMYDEPGTRVPRGMRNSRRSRGRDPRAARGARDSRDTREFGGGLIRAADRMSKLAVLSVIAATVLFGSFMAITAYSDNAVKGYAESAARLLADGEHARAAGFYTRYLNKYPMDKAALLGLLSASAAYDKPAARDCARELLDGGLLTAADFPGFSTLCSGLGDRELSVAAYDRWLALSPGHVSAMIELAKERIADGAFDPALVIIQSLLDSGQRPVAAVLLGQAVERAQNGGLSADKLVGLCELRLEVDGENEAARLALARAYIGAGSPAAAEDMYRKAIDANVRSAEAYDGLCGLLYQNTRLRERYDLLEAAVRNVGSQKYRDMLETTRAKLAEYYSRVEQGGVVYRDGIYRISRFDPDGVEITSEDASAIAPDETSYLIEYYDTLGDAKEMFLDSASTQARIEDIDFDGVREVIIKRYFAEGIEGLSADAAQSAVWRDVFQIDRDLNRLIYSTPDYPKYFNNTVAPELGRAMAQFERLSEAMEGHYGVTYGLLYGVRQAALGFAGGDWVPDNSGEALRNRVAEALIVPGLEQYVLDKNTAFGQADGDFRAVLGGAGMSETDAAAGAAEDGGETAATAEIYPGMTEAAATELLGRPRHITEEEMRARLPDGTTADYLNRIVEFTGLNLYTNGGAVKGLRVNSRDYAGPRGLRIGDTVRDIINKFPALYFDDVENYPTQKTDAEIEFTDTEQGIVLNYTVKGGVIMGIELFFRDATGDWKPGTNIETVVPVGQTAQAVPAAQNGDTTLPSAETTPSAETVPSAETTAAQTTDGGQPLSPAGQSATPTEQSDTPTEQSATPTEQPDAEPAGAEPTSGTGAADDTTTVVGDIPAAAGPVPGVNAAGELGGAATAEPAAVAVPSAEQPTSPPEILDPDHLAAPDDSVLRDDGRADPRAGAASTTVPIVVAVG